MKREWYVPAGQSVWRYDVDKGINGQGEFSLLIGSLSNDNQVVTLLNAGNSNTNDETQHCRVSSSTRAHPTIPKHGMCTTSGEIV
jgi:hypothetical protein